MALTKTTVGVTNISDLSSTPNATEGLTAAQLQAKFDKTGADLKTYINDTLTTELDAYHGNVSATELGYLDGVTSAIQTQFTGKIAVDGWIPTTGTYASASTITVASGAASKYRKGDKIKLTQSTVKYFIIVGIADTLLTVTGGSDYTVANATITDMYYSHESTPTTFPTYFNYTPTVTATSGTITTSSASAKFTVINGLCVISGETTLTNKGTGTGDLFSSLPIANIAQTIGSGRENAVVGVLTQVLVESSKTKFFKYDGSSMLVDGYTIIYTVIYNI